LSAARLNLRRVKPVNPPQELLRKALYRDVVLYITFPLVKGSGQEVIGCVVMPSVKCLLGEGY
jgi:hypothetical protein